MHNPSTPKAKPSIVATLNTISSTSLLNPNVFPYHLLDIMKIKHSHILQLKSRRPPAMYLLAMIISDMLNIGVVQKGLQLYLIELSSAKVAACLLLLSQLCFLTLEVCIV